ncbi:CYTH domain-containing protein [candidate division GN15 bacterium]|nr:CYTH domain-containing protein [candidate division GN15 bacterium]
MGSTEQNLEIEIKLKLDSFADYLKLIGFLGNPDKEVNQLNCFFDSEDHRLMKDGWALRVRAENDRGLITLKGAADSDHDLTVVREEFETIIERSAALAIINLQNDILAAPAEPIEFVKHKYPDIALAKLAQFTNIRQMKNFKIGDYTHVLELDRTEYADGSVDYELEMELDNPDQSDIVIPSLQKLFASLDIPFQRQDQTKFIRALEKTRQF